MDHLVNVNQYENVTFIEPHHWWVEDAFYCTQAQVTHCSGMNSVHTSHQEDCESHVLSFHISVLDAAND